MRSPLAGFVALLRAAGLVIASERLLLAEQALDAVGLLDRGRLHAVLRTSLCSTADELPLFDAAFALYWRAPDSRLQDLLPALPPLAQLRPRRPPQAGPPRRLLDAITPPHAWRPAEQPPGIARLGASGAEDDRAGHFEDPAATELNAARRLASAIADRLPEPPRGRRWQPAAQGAIDLRRALRQLQAGKPLLGLPRRRRRPPPRTVLLLVDASGSMQESLRELLLAVHALAQRDGRDWRLWAFSGSRLLALSPLLRREREPETALQRLAELGLAARAGTRIGAALQQLMTQEAPRLQAGRCSLLLLSDGLDHDPADPLLPQQLAAWKQRGARLVWIDPLWERDNLHASRALAEGVDARWALTPAQRLTPGSHLSSSMTT